MRFVRLVVLFLCLLTHQGGVLADDRGMEILQQAVLNRGSLVIRTGEFRYQLRVTESPPSEQEIQGETKEVVDLLKEQLRQEKSPEATKWMQQLIDDVPGEYAEQALANADLRMNLYFALSGPELGGDRYLEFSTFDRKNETFGNNSLLLLRHQGSGRGVSVNFEALSQSVIVGGSDRKDIYQPSQEPHQLGRLVGTLSFLLATVEQQGVKGWLDKNTTEIKVGSFLDEQDIETFKLEFKIKVEIPTVPPQSGTVSVIYHVVPSRGFITPLIQEFDSSGQLQVECHSQNYALVAGSDLWFPQLCEFKFFIPQKKAPRVESYSFDRDGLLFNHEIPNERFALSIPPKTPVTDARGGANKNYRTTHALSLTIDDTAQLSQLDGLITSPEPQVSQPVPLQRSDRFLLILGGNCVFLLVVFWMIAKRSTKYPSPPSGDAKS